jgi:hypothetical protein
VHFGNIVGQFFVLADFFSFVPLNHRRRGDSAFFQQWARRGDTSRAEVIPAKFCERRVRADEQR